MPIPIPPGAADGTWTPLESAGTSTSDAGGCASCAAAVSDGDVCNDCEYCDRCESPVPRQDTVTTERGSVICAACRSAHYVRCGHCDGWNRCGDPCGGGCDDGADDDDDDGDDGDDADPDLIFHYSYQPYPIFHGSGRLFLGAEIELETPYDGRGRCARLAAEHLGSLGYLKDDSSIDGFEIVTHPMSYEWALDYFPWPMLGELSDAGCEATTATGIHVHVSRDGFSDACHTYRWMKFIYRNEDDVVRLARRYSGEWAAFTEQDRRNVKHFAKGAQGDRYRAINTNNASTFELRIFAGSLDVREVQAALAFAAASIEYTRQLTVPEIVHDGGWTWPAFTDWVAQHPRYAPLSRQLEAQSCVC